MLHTSRSHRPSSIPQNCAGRKTKGSDVVNKLRPLVETNLRLGHKLETFPPHQVKHSSVCVRVCTCHSAGGGGGEEEDELLDEGRLRDLAVLDGADGGAVDGTDALRGLQRMREESVG